MNKKVLKAMYRNIVTSDFLRPTLQGVHFEENRCYATDTHMLVIYNEGDSRFMGCTLNLAGESLKGTYPDVDRVVPKTMPYEALPINVTQLYKALQWHLRQEKSTREDKVAFGEYIVTIDYLAKTLAVFNEAGELALTQIYLNEVGRPCKLISPSLSAIIMPVNGEGVNIDGDREAYEFAVLSYETLINNYAFNGWKPTKKAESLSWL